MSNPLIHECSQRLKEKNLTISFAESATAGRVASEFALIPDCGKVLKGGIICYDACIKQDVLGIPRSIIEEFTPESAEVTKELAQRLSAFIKADVQVGITGLTMAGGSETADKPVGTMFLYFLMKNNSVAVHKVFDGTPEEIVYQTVDVVAQTLLDELR